AAAPRGSRSRRGTRSTSADRRRTAPPTCAREQNPPPAATDLWCRPSRTLLRHSPDGKYARTSTLTSRLHLPILASSGRPVHVPYERQRTQVKWYSTTPVSRFSRVSTSSGDWQR